MTEMINRWWDKLFNGELPEPAEANDNKWRRAWKLIIALFAVQFASIVVVDAMFNHNIMLGPGLVDTGMSAFDWALHTIQPLLDEKRFVFIGILLAGCILAMMVNAIVTYRGFTHYRDKDGKPYPLQVMHTFFLLNGALVAMMILTLVMCGLAAWILGFTGTGLSFSDGMSVIQAMTAYSHSLVDRVPTLVNLPYPLPLIAAMLVVDFFFYWFHRLGHTQRSWWLLWHRPHHMTPILTHPTTQPVFAAFPLFLIFSIPFQIIVGVLAKIFGPETMIMEALLLRVFTQYYAPYAHNSAYYEWFGKSRWRMFWGNALGLGNYHYMHHSALPGHEAVNISGNLFFFWDRVFGTYVKPTKEKPPVGLTGSPDIYMNPLRLALSGVAQLAYEWRNNKDWNTRFKILFAGTDWNPPITKDFAIKEALVKPC